MRERMRDREWQRETRWVEVKERQRKRKTRKIIGDIQWVL